MLIKAKTPDGTFTYPAHKGEDGRIYAKANRIVRQYVNHAKNRGLDLNDIAENYSNELYTLKEMLDFYMAIGYSLNGLEELSYFQFCNFTVEE